MTQPNDSPQFDLDAWMGDAMPGLLAAEAADDWQGRSARPVRRPVTELTADDSPVNIFLRMPDEPPEGANREDRRSFYDSRDAARAAALEAAQDAAEDHARAVEARSMRAAADTFDRVVSDAARRAREADEGSQVPVKGPDQPADLGRW